MRMPRCYHAGTGSVAESRRYGGWVRVRVFVEPQQGATYDQFLAVARVAEANRFDGFFRSDHFYPMGGDGLPGPTDAWITLAGLARETTRLRLGTFVTSATFRLPGPLAIAVAQVDAMSGGRSSSASVLDGLATSTRPTAFRSQPLRRALRSPGGSVGDRDRPLVHASRCNVQLLQSPLRAERQPGPAEADADAGTAHHYWRFRGEADPETGGRFASEFNLAFHGLDDTECSFNG